MRRNPNAGAGRSSGSRLLRWRWLPLAANPGRLDTTGSDVLREVLRAFANVPASADTPLVLVLDDYHLGTSAQAHAPVARLPDRPQPSCT